MATRVLGKQGSDDATGTGRATGYLAHAEGQSTTASGGEGPHAEGKSSTASGNASHAEGVSTVASGNASHAEGDSTFATANLSHAEGYGSAAQATAAHAEGNSSSASGYCSHAEGMQSLAGRYAQDAKAAGYFTTTGDAQASRFVARRITTDAVAAILTFDGGAAATLSGANTNVLTIPINRAHRFRVDVVARRSDVSGDAAGWEFTGLIVRGASGNATFVNAVDGKAWGSNGAMPWDVTLSIDTTDVTNNYLKVTATGEAAKTIRWVATISTTEVG